MVRTSLVISGATGSGKSELAVALAQALNGEIVNADSVQVYSEHRIGGALPSPELVREVPHHLFEILSGEVEFDVSKYSELVREKVSEIREREVLPVFCGGSTLYLQSVFDGLSPLPESSPAIRKALEGKTTGELYAELFRTDQKRAEELHENDRIRIVRSLEVIEISGVPYTELLRAYEKDSLPGTSLFVIPIWERDLLYERIDARSKKMVEAGILSETKGFFESFGEKWRSKGALGYAQSLEVLEKESTSEAELSEAIAQSTRRYAKRQMTFWRNSPSKFGWKTLPKNEATRRYLGAESGKEGRASEERLGFPVFEYTLDELREALSHRLRTIKEGEPHEVWYCEASRLFSS